MNASEARSEERPVWLEPRGRDRAPTPSSATVDGTEVVLYYMPIYKYRSIDVGPAEPPGAG